MSIETESIFFKKNSQQNPASQGFNVELYQTLEKSCIYPSQNIPKNCRGRNASELILRGQYYPNTKTKDRHTHTKLQVQKILNKNIKN